MPEKTWPIIGYLKSGKPVYQMAGGDGTETPPNGESGAGDPPETKPDKTFTQPELDAIVSDRLRRERAQFSDYDDLKAKAAKYDAAEDNKKDELQKANDAKAAAETAGAAAITTAKAMLKRAAIIEAAAKSGALDADVMVLLLSSDESITVGDDGKVDGVTDAMAKAFVEKPHLKAGTTPPRSGAQFNGNDTKTIDERIAEAEKAGDLTTMIALKQQRFISQQTS